MDIAGKQTGDKQLSNKQRRYIEGPLICLQSYNFVIPIGSV